MGKQRNREKVIKDRKTDRQNGREMRKVRETYRDNIFMKSIIPRFAHKGINPLTCEASLIVYNQLITYYKHVIFTKNTQNTLQIILTINKEIKREKSVGEGAREKKRDEDLGRQTNKQTQRKLDHQQRPIILCRACFIRKILA